MHDPTMQQPSSNLLLFRARLLLEEGQGEQAMAELEGLQVDGEKQRQEKDYFLGWSYILTRCWDDAMRVLLPLTHREEDQDNQGEAIDRERHACSLLRLGYAAINLNHFTDAERHLRTCLRLLRHKQLQRPELQLLRIQSHYSLGVSYAMRGFYTAALQHYEEALRLFLYVDDDEELANVYYGLCDTYRRAGRLEEARLAGEKALQLYERTANRPLEGRIRNQLGNIALVQGDLKKAGDYFTDALAIAASLNGVQMVMINCEDLAKLHTAEGHFSRARKYCRMALEMSRQTKNYYLRGCAYLTAGRVALAEAGQAGSERRQELLEEAIEQFQIARTNFSSTEAYDEITETLTSWAQACEGLGRSQESLALWRTVYQTQARARGLE